MEPIERPGQSSKSAAASSDQTASERSHNALAIALRDAAASSQNQCGQTLQWLQPFSVAPLSVADTDARFNEAHPPGPRGIKRRGGGRPRKPDSELKRPRADPRSRPTKLRPNATVELHVPSDVWYHIFLFADYKTVRSLRQTCRDTYEATNSVIFWKEYIHRHANPPQRVLPLSLPKLPHGLTLSQYADLLFGQGCMRCGAAKSKKVQWAFYRRWCKICFSEMTYSDSEAKGITTKYGDLLGCIPTGIIDIWKNYHCVSQLTANEIAANYRSMKKYVAVTKSDLTAIVNDCEAFLEALPLDLGEADREDQLKAWRQERTTENAAYLAHAKKCEDFATIREETIAHYSNSEGQSYRKQRDEFFTQKAAQLQPAVSQKVLRKIPGYQKSIAVKRPPTERSWREILHNIELYREAAEKASVQDITLPPIRALALFEQHATRRSSTQSDTPATSLLEELAEDAMKALEWEQTAAEDFTYLALQRVRKMYYDLPPSDRPAMNDGDLLKPDDGSTYYVLTMQDALHIYHRKIAPRLIAWCHSGKIKRLPSFYCPGCTRRDYRREWSFNKLFSHLSYAHAKKDLSSPWRCYAETNWAREATGIFTELFHWQAIPWPHNLPILAAHHKPTGRWEPDDENYECAPPVEKLPEISPFEGRSVRKCQSKDSSAVLIAIEAILEAAQILSGIKRTPQIKALIAWRYATENVDKFATEKLAPHHLDDLSTALIRKGQFDIFSKVGCKFCDMQNDPQAETYMSIRSHLKYTEMKHSFDTIARHWKQDHVGANDRFDVANEMLLLPSHAELANELCDSGNPEDPSADLLLDVLDYLFPFADSSENLSEPGCGEYDPVEESKSTTQFGPSTRSLAKRRGQAFANQAGGKGKNPASATLDQTALNLLAEQAVKIDPRLTVDGEIDEDEDEDGGSDAEDASRDEQIGDAGEEAEG